MSRANQFRHLIYVPAQLLLISCAGGEREPLRLDAMVAFPPRDTIRFDLPAATHRCGDKRSLLLEALSPAGSGVLIRLHFGDSLIAGLYPLTAPGDSVTVPGASVGIRYLLRDVSHGFTVDSGAVRVEVHGKEVSAHVTGSGLENAIRAKTRIDFRDVPISPDTVPCKYAP